MSLTLAGTIDPRPVLLRPFEFSLTLGLLVHVTHTIVFYFSVLVCEVVNIFGRNRTGPGALQCFPLERWRRPSDAVNSPSRGRRDFLFRSVRCNGLNVSPPIIGHQIVQCVPTAEQLFFVVGCKGLFFAAQIGILYVLKSGLSLKPFNDKAREQSTGLLAQSYNFCLAVA